MKRVGILLENTYEDLEVWYPLLRLREAGLESFTISTEAGKTYTSKYGYPCEADKSIDEVTCDSLDALVIPGGWCPDLLRRDERFVSLVRSMVSADKPVGSICRGAWLLCSAECVTGRRVACLPAIKVDVKNAGATFEDAAVVVDGNLVTSRVPPDLPQFLSALLDRINAAAAK